MQNAWHASVYKSEFALHLHLPGSNRPFFEHPRSCLQRYWQSRSCVQALAEEEVARATAAAELQSARAQRDAAQADAVRSQVRAQWKRARLTVHCAVACLGSADNLPFGCWDAFSVRAGELARRGAACLGSRDPHPLVAGMLPLPVRLQVVFCVCILARVREATVLFLKVTIFPNQCVEQTETCSCFI